MTNDDRRLRVEILYSIQVRQTISRPELQALLGDKPVERWLQENPDLPIVKVKGDYQLTTEKPQRKNRPLLPNVETNGLGGISALRQR